MPSRGNAISAYSPAFARGAKVYGANIQSGVITSAHIADGTVVAADVAAGSITSAKIGTGAVTSIKLASASVISAKIGTGAVLAAAIGAAAVTSAKIKGYFTSGSIVSGGVTYAVAHGLGAKPKVVIVKELLTAGQIASATVLRLFHMATVSADTSTNVYIKGNQVGAMKYQIIALG